MPGDWGIEFPTIVIVVYSIYGDALTLWHGVAWCETRGWEMVQQVTIKTSDRARLKPLLRSAIENEKKMLL